MSRGELWVHFLLYVFRTARPGSTLFIDEPETYLSPVGHVALFDELARSTLAAASRRSSPRTRPP
ncbi:hypothetical protein [Nocardia abscessus]|uniref:hypothetical protein n=1 Tax=Nocardia abscessus TaxID=120957 RepID=UPI003CC7D58F